MDFNGHADALHRAVYENTNGRLPRGNRPNELTKTWVLVHPAHAATHAAAARHAALTLVLLLDLGDHRLGGQHQARDGSGVEQRGRGHLGRIDDAGRDQVLELAGGRVETAVAVGGQQLAHDHRALFARVHRDLAGRLLQRPTDDVDAHLDVALGLDGLDGLDGAQQGHATAGDDALLDGRLGGMHGVLDAGLLLLHFSLGRGADLDHRHAADQLGQPLLQLLAVVVRGGLLDLVADLLDAARDRLTALGVVRVGHDRGVVLGQHDLLGVAEVLPADVLELDAEVVGDHPAAGQDRDVLQHGLAAVAEARGLDRGHVQGAAQLVDHQGGQRLALDVLGDDQERTALLGHLLQHREEVLHRADLLLVEQDLAVLEHGLHALGVGDEVRRQVAAVELHALDHLQGGLEAARLLDRDHAVLADLLHRLGDDAADLLVVVRGDGADVRDVLALDGLGQLVDGLDGGPDGQLDATLDLHRVRTRGDVLGALAIDRLGEHGRGGGAVAGHVGGLRSDLAHHLSAHVLERIGQLDLLGHRHAVLGDGRRAELLLDNDVASLGAEGHLDRVSQLVDTPKDRGARVPGVDNLLSHVSNLL